MKSKIKEKVMEKLKSKIEETVLEIMNKAELKDMSELNIKTVASNKLGFDLSKKPKYEKIARRAIESFFISMEEVPVTESPPPPPPPPKTTARTTEENEPKEISNEEKEEEGIERKSSFGATDLDENGNLIICKLSNKRKVTVEDYEGKTLVSARNYYLKDAEQLIHSPKEMDPEIQTKIERTVMDILNKRESDDMSELNVQNIASEKLGMDLSGPECQQLVRHVIESFFISMEEVPITEPARTEKEKAKESKEEEEEEVKEGEVEKSNKHVIESFLFSMEEAPIAVPAATEKEKAVESTEKEKLEEGEVGKSSRHVIESSLISMGEVPIAESAATQKEKAEERTEEEEELEEGEVGKSSRHVIESSLISIGEVPIAESAATEKEKAEERTEEEEELEEGEVGKDVYAAVIGKMSSKRGENVQDFKGKASLPTEQYCQKDEKEFPSSRVTQSLPETQPELMNKIKEMVLEILKKAEMEDMSEIKVQSVVSDKLGMDLSGPEYQQFIRRVIESFLLSIEEEPVEDQQ